jgi:2-(1,2-epoxy-1,2-dihydrophenyl)acetyl-CoA isomerase
MTNDTVLLDLADAIATITLNRPAQKNALNLEMRDALAEAIAQVRDDNEVKAVILHGAGGAFCSGGDIESMLDPSQTGLVWRERMRKLHRWFPELVNLEKPVIAAVDGVAFGAGFNLALAADFILATPRARFCAVFGRVGLVPDLGGLYLLPRIVGLQRAKEIVFSARIMDAEEVQRYGIVYAIHPEDALPTAARHLAARFKDASTGALGMAKTILNQSYHLDQRALAEMEAYAQTVCRETEYHRQMIARFVEKQPPLFDWERFEREEQGRG